MTKAEKILVKAPKGTKDVLPDEAEKREAFLEAVRGVYARYGYRRIDTPVFESEQLFARGIGEGTDIVNKEMYSFEDKGGRRLALRPEATAGVVRAYIENNMGVGAPLLKVFYEGPMFRYERPQGGRQRQFWQTGVEAIGVADPLLDAEVIDLAVACLTAGGLTDLTLRINSVGCPVCLPAYVAALRSYLCEAAGDFCETCRDRAKRNPMRVFDCKNEGCRRALKKAPVIKDYLCGDCRAHFENVLSGLDELNVAYVQDDSLVRGLDYYTRTTFELTSGSLGAQDAVAAGGRYDGLISLFGGLDTPGIGFAVGVERSLIAAEGYGEGTSRLDAVIIAMGEAAKMVGLKMANALRREGAAVDLDFTDKSLAKRLTAADRTGARYTVLIGEDELMTGSVTVRNMATGEQQSVEAEVVSEIVTGKS
ncbi:MAG: histidine--tRNA ligase [Actinomycetota bacterium]